MDPLTIAALFQVGSSLFSAFTGNRAAAQRQRAADRMAKDAIARGEEDANVFGQKLRVMLGRQRAVLGASGVDLNVGSARQVVTETERIGNEDIRRIRLNAGREAYGIRATGRIEARQMRNQAFGSAMQGVGTLIGMAADPWDNWQGRRRASASMTGRADASFDARWNSTDWGG